MGISDTDILFGKPEDPDPRADKTYLAVSSAVALMVLSIVAVFLRFLSRWVVRVPFMLDDWLILVALPFSVALPAISIFGVYQGYYARHLVSAPDPSGYLSIFMKGLFVYDIAYNFAIAFAKLSMLAIYWRVFHSGSFKLPLLVTSGATVAWLIACTLVAIFSCTPVQGFWDRSTHAKCINNFSFYVGQAVCNIAIDIALLVIPVFRVSRLSITMLQKVAVSGIFLLGAFTTIASALRLNELVKSLYVTFQDPTFELVGSGVWSEIETGLSIVCACLPTMRPLLRLALHGSPYPTSGISGARDRNYGRPESRSRSRTPGNWPLQKRISGMRSPTRDSFRLQQPDAAHVSPTGYREDDRPWDGRSERQLVPNARSFATTRQYASMSPTPREKGTDIEMQDRGFGGGYGYEHEHGHGHGGGHGGGGNKIGVARTTAFDEVSEDGSSAGMTEGTDTIKYHEGTRPVDGF